MSLSLSASASWERAIAIASEQRIFDIPVADHLIKTKQEQLPQADLIKGVLDALVEEDALEEAYMRGSFSYGLADELSDVDLFVVVEPEKLDEAYKAATEYLEEHYPIIIGCHDRLVKDFGGIGFMFICDSGNGDLTQLDLYFAMKGVQPKASLKECHRVYTKDERYFWAAEHQNVPLPDSAAKFIAEHTADEDPSEKLDVLAREMIVTMSIMNKHLKRGQVFRASNDDRHATDLNIEMLSIISGQPEFVHTPLYMADDLTEKLEAGGTRELSGISTKLKKVLLTPIGSEKITQHLDLMESILCTRPKKHADLLRSLQASRAVVFQRQWQKRADGCGSITIVSWNRQKRA